MKRTYTAAIIELVDSGAAVDDVLRGVKSVMVARGHDRLYTQVLRAVLRTLSARATRAGITVTVAREADVTALADAIEAAVAALKTDATYTVTIDKTIVGGFIARSTEHIVDHSFKTALLKLYRSVTH